MRTLALLCVALVVLAGCLGAGGGDTTPTTDRTPTDGPTPTAHPDCRDPTTVTPVPLPDPPRTLTKETAGDYAAGLENARIINDHTDDIRVSGGAHVEWVNATADGYLVHLEGGVASYDCDDGMLAVGDGFVRVTYFVNDSVVLRSTDGPEPGASDPREEGTVVEV